ncbi:hypothetical protein C9374_007583 [Naegleria lovaniensis]|uniref:Uncharacterized protein n=1 Tax=Naegleria lovaniensis TaxID=51637 RepID=A0AA88GL26_NAELO|nr:uncharacterized protein C9374_007583 [Naegleria lovaniensis]KAG2378945.1 hypothetical protein C9374_007583 [Naegleria lovaniensis]
MATRLSTTPQQPSLLEAFLFMNQDDPAASNTSGDFGNEFVIHENSWLIPKYYHEMFSESSDSSTTLNELSKWINSNNLSDVLIKNRASYLMATHFLVTKQISQFQQAFTLLYRSADVYAPSQYNVAQFFDVGIGMPQSLETAFEWYHLAAQQGLVYAEFMCAQMYEFGEGVDDIDYVQAFEWYLKAAAKGHPTAYHNVASFYYYGKGNAVQVNHALAFEYYKKAAKSGIAHSQSQLGYMHLKGEGTSKSSQKAFKWYSRAADQNFARAQLNLGKMYEFGEEQVTPQNDAMALAWYMKAAIQDNADAQYAVGRFMYEGKGLVEPNLNLALEWFEKAANQGHEEAQLVLMRALREDGN